MTENSSKEPRRAPKHRRLIVLSLIAAVLLAALGGLQLLGGSDDSDEISLSEALTQISDGAVKSAALDDWTSLITLTFVDEDKAPATAQYPSAFSDELTELLVDEDVEVEASMTSEGAGKALLRILPIVLILAMMLWSVKSASPGKMLGAKKKRALEAGEIPTVTFDDVAGADEAVAELREMVSFLRDPSHFEAVGATHPRGALLAGPPGTGKTLLARAVAGEAQVPFFALAGSDFVETFAGMGARRVRDLFAQARKAERAIIFIDEIDAVGRSRSSGPTQGGDSERENTLIALLHELDGFLGSRVVVLAATNRADTLDAALTRPGRLDKLVQVPNPDRGGRSRILAVHAKGKPIGEDVDFVRVARQTPGMSGADLAQVVNEACMEAARRNLEVVDAECFQAAVATTAMGRARTSALVTEFDRRVTAWHEAGHALAAAVLPDADDPMSVTIVPRGPAGGVTWMSGNDDLFLTRDKARARLTVALAGRAAEERLLDGGFTQGAAGDLDSATKLATAMVTQYAMTGFGYTQVDPDTLRLGGIVAAEAHRYVEELLVEAHAAATALLAAHPKALQTIAEALLVEETLTGHQVHQLLEAASLAV